MAARNHSHPIPSILTSIIGHKMNKLANLLRAHINEEERELLAKKNGRDPKEHGSALERILGIQNSPGGQDTVLARISPADARLLKKRGGSGDIDPHTGRIHFGDENGDAGNGTEGSTSTGEDGGGFGGSDEGTGGGYSGTPGNAGMDNEGFDNPDNNGYDTGNNTYGGDALGGFENDAPGRGWGPSDEPGMPESPSLDPGPDPDNLGFSGGYGAPGGGLAGADLGGFSEPGSGQDDVYDEDKGAIGKSGRDFSPEALTAAQAAYSANPAAFNQQNNPAAPEPGFLDDFANWASRNEVYSQPGAGAKGALDSLGTNFGDPHSANANSFQSFLTQNGLQDIAAYGVPALATLLGGPVTGALAGLGFNAAKGDNVTTQGLSTLGGIVGGGPGAAIGSIAGNTLQGNYTGALGTALNAGLNYGGMNLGSMLGKEFDGPVGQTIGGYVGNLAQNYGVDYAANALGDAIGSPGTSNTSTNPDNLFAGYDGSTGGDSSTSIDGDFGGGLGLASLLSGGGGSSIIGGGGGGGGSTDFSDYDQLKNQFIGSKKKSRYRQPSSLMALLGEENGA